MLGHINSIGYKSYRKKFDCRNEIEQRIHKLDIHTKGLLPFETSQGTIDANCYIEWQNWEQASYILPRSNVLLGPVHSSKPPFVDRPTLEITPSGVYTINSLGKLTTATVCSYASGIKDSSTPLEPMVMTYCLRSNELYFKARIYLHRVENMLTRDSSLLFLCMKHLSLWLHWKVTI